MNRLAGEPSAYLRQHAQNPVAWQPFDAEAFAESVARDVPIFLSVGYAACHWCHVMAGESFEDPVTADYLNEHFVSIKVDREERPDVDDAYMAATQALSGEGGWPMSVFLTPEGKAFYAGTYFPPSPGRGRPSFTQVLAAVNEAWCERRDQVEKTAESLSEALAKPIWQVRSAATTAVELSVQPEPAWLRATEDAVAAIAGTEDLIHGGFGSAPKFPPTPGLEFLIRHAASKATDTATGASAKQAHGLVGRTLNAMVHSALFDQLGGGFARYSVSADWSEPHYEKMLYDNAGLLQVLVHWVRIAEKFPQQSLADDEPGLRARVPSLGARGAREAAVATISWLMDEMRLPGGAFASSLDADTVVDGIHHEGASYKWSMAELQTAAHASTELGSQKLAEDVARAMGVPNDAVPQTYPLHPSRPLSELQQKQWERIKPALRRLRAARVMPARDEKVVASWNAMLMEALAEAAMVLEEPAYLATAVELGEYLSTVHWDGELLRVSHDGQARGIKGLLEDYAACAKGYLTLYAASGDRRWFDFAGTLICDLERDFIADGVVYNHGAHEGSDSALQGSRFADPFDNATTSAVAMMAGAFISWSAYTGSGRHRVIAENLLAGVPELAKRAPRSAGGLLAQAEALLAGPFETAIVGPAGHDREKLLHAAWCSASPGMVIGVWDGAGEPPLALFEGRSVAQRPCKQGQQPVAAGVLAYICRNMVCTNPVSTALEVRQRFI